MRCIDNILKLYEIHKKDPRVKKEMEFNKILITIMDKSKNKLINKSILENCLILLLNLWTENDYPDYLTIKGKNAKDLKNKEKIKLFSILEAEFCNN